MNTKHLTIIMHKSYYNLLLDIQCACNPSAHSSGRKPHDEMNSKAPELLMQHMYIINDLITSLTHTHTHSTIHRHIQSNAACLGEDVLQLLKMKHLMRMKLHCSSSTRPWRYTSNYTITQNNKKNNNTHDITTYAIVAWASGWAIISRHSASIACNIQIKL